MRLHLFWQINGDAVIHDFTNCICDKRYKSTACPRLVNHSRYLRRRRVEEQHSGPFKNGGFIPGGWPNGRRFGDDVVDIAVTALISDLRDPNNLIIRGPAGDGVDRNDMAFNKSVITLPATIVEPYCR